MARYYDIADVATMARRWKRRIDREIPLWERGRTRKEPALAGYTCCPAHTYLANRHCDDGTERTDFYVYNAEVLRGHGLDSVLRVSQGDWCDETQIV
jgi:hypothetical protein